MTTVEFSNEFDLLYNNITSNSAPGINEYEKSLFLTQAQEQFVVSLYTGAHGESFESTESLRRSLNNLVKVNQAEKITSTVLPISDNSIFYKYADDVWYRVYEEVIFSDGSLSCLNGKRGKVVPITHDEYHTISENPFRGAGKRKVLRIDSGKETSGLVDSGIVEIISKYNIGKYVVRYLTKPTPIILEDLTNYGVSIDGVQVITECKLNSLVHRSILMLAVNLAKEAWVSASQ